MSAARGTRYLEEVRLKQVEGQRLRTEARVLQLKIVELEARLADLERFRQEIQGRLTARCLPFGCAFLSTFFLLFRFFLLSFYGSPSSIRAPPVN